MAKVRVYELAKQFGVESQVVMAMLKELGEFVRSASSTLEAPVVRRLTDALQLSELARAGKDSDVAGPEQPPMSALDDTDEPPTEFEILDEDLTVYERDRRHHTAMSRPAVVLRHEEETPETAIASEEIRQLRVEMSQLRKDQAALATRTATTSLGVEVTGLRKQVAELREEITDLHHEVERLEDAHALKTELGDLDSEVENLRNCYESVRDGITDSRERFGARLKDLKDADAQLRKQVATLQSEVAELLLSNRRPEHRDRQMPPSPPPQLPPSPGAPIHLRGLIGSLMPETPGEIYRAQQAWNRAPGGD